MTKDNLYLFDTTLRDGNQTPGVDFSLDDKNRISSILDELGVDYIEGGYPGANPIDTDFFKAQPKLKKSKFLSCPNCNSYKIKKSLMAPSVINNKKENNNLNLKKHLEVKNKLKKYKNFIKKNFEYVGDNFTYEARSIHYNNKKSKKGIYGTASNEEVKELKEEGIQTEIIPWVEDKSN